MTNISKKLHKVLPKAAMNILKTVGKTADGYGYKVYLVGGMVRDIFLGIGQIDFDFTVERDAVKFAETLAKKLKGKVVNYKRFGTATIYARNGLRTDLSTARREKYVKPGALPKVRPGVIRDDMHRRDFTVNAMAVSLNKCRFGELIDFYGGIRDLKEKRISVLHEESFIDDATRILRAVRFESRYGFRMDARTESLLKKALKRKIFSTISPERFRNEIVYLLNEPEPIKPLERMKELGILRFIDGSMKLSEESAGIIRNIGKSIRQDKALYGDSGIKGWLIYLMALTHGFKRNRLEGLSSKLALSSDERKKLLSLESLPAKERFLRSGKRLPPSRVFSLLKDLSPEAMVLLASSGGSKRLNARVREYLKKYSDAGLLISGEDFKKRGFVPGPAFRRVLEDTLYAKLDGKIKGKNQELDFAITRLQYGKREMI
ncbi:MAG: hypothetical protein AUJ75_03945 [Candidatus Omnitrophica bacterium CG1_02_49_10]|nr:MAG: hypothetical protein AUJ75_03945 [Candidatus Omnitrophica bacterium CG1_02_49_10]